MIPLVYKHEIAADTGMLFQLWCVFFENVKQLICWRVHLNELHTFQTEK
jgi:hypothetical protein